MSMNAFRVNIIEALQVIALKSMQIDLYEQHEQVIDVPDQLLKRWEQVYRPDKEGFENEFSEAELKQMNCFTDFYLARVKSFPSGLNELMKDPYWASVCEFAGELLQDFEKSGETELSNN